MLIAPALTLHSNPNLLPDDKSGLIPDDNAGLYKAGGALAGIALLIYGIRKYKGNYSASSVETEKAAAYAKSTSFSPDPGVTCYRYYSQFSCVKN